MVVETFLRDILTSSFIAPARGPVAAPQALPDLGPRETLGPQRGHLLAGEIQAGPAAVDAPARGIAHADDRSFPELLDFKFCDPCEDGNHEAGHGVGPGPDLDPLVGGNEDHAKPPELRDAGLQVGRAAAEAGQAPDHDDVELTAPRRAHELLEAGAVVAPAAAGLLDVEDNRDAPHLCRGMELPACHAGILVK